VQPMEPSQPEKVKTKRPARAKKTDYEPKQGDAKPAGKYDRKQRIGKEPKIGTPPNLVTKVGLGKVKTITNYGQHTDVQSYRG